MTLAGLRPGIPRVLSIAETIEVAIAGLDVARVAIPLVDGSNRERYLMLAAPEGKCWLLEVGTGTVSPL